MYRGFLEWAKYNVKGEDLSKDKETRVTTHNALVYFNIIKFKKTP